MIELLFLLGFTLHNLEEAIWLPGWSENAGKFHKQVTPHQFYFTVIIITAIGYLLTFQHFIFGEESLISQYSYLGFIAMMVLNAIFPHVAATIAFKKYAPGTITALMLNVPIGIYILAQATTKKLDFLYLLIATAIITIIILLLIHLLFELSAKLFDK